MMTVNIWVMVLALPKIEAEITVPDLAIIMRMPSTAKSRIRIMANIQSGIRSNTTSARKVRLINILSARGSKKAPRSVTILALLAQRPSIKSVMEATAKNIMAATLAGRLSRKIQIISGATKMIRSRVRTVGPLISLPPVRVLFVIIRPSDVQPARHELWQIWQRERR